MLGAGGNLQMLAAAGRIGRYLAAGAGPPVVLLASPLALARPYRPTVRALAEGHRVYLVEPPGCGRAERLDEAWGIDEYADWAAAALVALGLADATVIGHSHTGGVVVALAERSLGRVGRVVVADGIGTYRQSLGSALAGRLTDALTVEGRLTAREWAAVAASAAAHWGNFARQTRVCLRDDLTGPAARVTVPVLLAWGARDYTLPPGSAAEYARHLPRAEVYVSAGGSHAWLITHAAEFAAAVGAFVRRHPPGAVT